MYNFKEFIHYIEVFWGAILASIFSMVLGYFFGSIGSYLGMIIVTMWIGYILSEDIIIGALNGALVGVFGGMLSIILMLIMGSLGLGPGSSIMMFGIAGIIIGLSINFIVGVCGGAIGSAL